MNDLSIAGPETPEVAFEPAELDAPPTVDQEAAAAAIPDVDPLTVRALLATAGGTLALALADEDVDGHWQFTAAELTAMTPPLCRMVNRIPRAKELVNKGDGLVVVMHLLGYGQRNLIAGHQARRARQEYEDGDLGREAGPAGPAAAGDGDGAGDGRPGEYGHGATPGAVAGLGQFEG